VLRIGLLHVGLLRVNNAMRAAPVYATQVAALAAQAPLQGAERADVAILGAGFTGLSAAIELAQRGFSVVVLEASRVGSGASGRNGGQAIFGFGCDQSVITAQVGLEVSRRLFDASLEGVAMLHERCADFGIDCEWRAGHAHVPIRPRQVRELQAWQAKLARDHGYALDWWERERLRAVLASDRYLGALYDPRSGHLQPLKYVLGLAHAAQSLGVRIFEGSQVLALERGTRPALRTASGRVTADFVVLAGNALVRGVAPELDARIMPVGTYIGATPPLGAARAAALIGNAMAVADVNWALDYFRVDAAHRLLFGGRASYSALEPGNLRATMARRMRRVFPQLADVELEAAWGGFVDISRNRAPDWGRLGDNVYYAQGFSGHGVAATGLAGRVIAEAIAGQAARLDAFAAIGHKPFPGGRALRTPLLVAAMAWFKLRDALW
jgi:gamma-glutamylputrescine oxidase